MCRHPQKCINDQCIARFINQLRFLFIFIFKVNLFCQNMQALFDRWNYVECRIGLLTKIMIVIFVLNIAILVIVSNTVFQDIVLFITSAFVSIHMFVYYIAGTFLSHRLLHWLYFFVVASLVLQNYLKFEYCTIFTGHYNHTNWTSVYKMLKHGKRVFCRFLQALTLLPGLPFFDPQAQQPKESRVICSTSYIFHILCLREGWAGVPSFGRHFSG